MTTRWAPGRRPAEGEPDRLLSPCDRLLLSALANGRAQADPGVPSLEDRGLSWNEAFAVADANRVASFVATLVNTDSRAAGVEERVRADWRAARMLYVFRAERAVEVIRTLGAAMSSVGVPMLLYKGPDFQLRYYTDACPRGFGDLDILVRRADIERAVAGLTAAGYHPLLASLPLAYYKRFHLHAAYGHGEHPWPVELHWALDSPFATTLDPVPLLFADGEGCAGLGASVLRPSAIDTLALMAGHLTKHLGLAATLPSRPARLKAVIDGGGLVWLLDVVRWMQRHGDERDPEEILGRMRTLEAERALVVALRLAADLDSSALPGWARELSTRLPDGTPLLARFIYPDYTAGRASSPRRRRFRSFLLTMRSDLGFRPVRVLEALLPRFRVPGVERERFAALMLRACRRAALLAANLAVLARMRFIEGRRRGRGPSGPSVTPQRPPAGSESGPIV